MSESSLHLEQDEVNVMNKANKLLINLFNSYNLLQELNHEIESRPHATKIHGQFDKELKKSQSIISRLSALLRKFYSFEFSSSLSLELKDNDEENASSKPIDTSFVIEFKDTCLKIEREWRIGTQRIMDYYAKYGNTNTTQTDHYFSDNDSPYKNNHNKLKRKSNPKSKARSRSPSPIHSFSNPNSPLFEPSRKAQKQMFLQKKANKTKMSSDFVPFNEEQEHRLNQQIRDINDDLQYLLEINKQVNDLVHDQDEKVTDVHDAVSDAQQNVEQGMYHITSIKKSPILYGVVGGMMMAAVGAPVMLVGAGMKAAIEGSLGLGTVGALAGSWYASKWNTKIDEDNANDFEQRLNDEDSVEMSESVKRVSGFKTKPRKRKNTLDTKNLNGYAESDDDEDVWDARN